MTQRHLVTRWLGALGLILSLVGLVSQDTTSAQTLADTQQRANQGDALAQTALGFIYQSGEGVPENFTQAVVWYRIAADQGYAPAQANLGVMYSNGTGVPQDLPEAAAWLLKAADQGYAPAQANLGVMYATGQGVPQDDVEAHKWLSLAAASLTGDTQQGYADYRSTTAQRMTPAQLAEAQRLAREWQAAFEKRQAD
ncbi:sel1 repeat family protein [bacterium AH-315-O15]|nr:sel1 repeat family protein [bacterium AH-315-O15]